SLVINDDFIAAPGAANPGVDLAPVGPAGRAGLRLHPDYEDYGCGYVDAWVDSDTGPLAVGNALSYTLFAQDCDYVNSNISPDATWQGDSTYGSINTNGSGSYYAANAGTGTLDANDVCEWWQVDEDPDDPPFGDLEFYCDGFSSRTIYVYPTISGNDDIWWFGGYDQSGYGYNMEDDLYTDSYGDNFYWQIDVNPAAISEGNDSASDFDIVPNGEDADAGGGFSGAVTCATATVNGVNSQVDACFNVLEPRFLQSNGLELFKNDKSCYPTFALPGFCDWWPWQIIDNTGNALPFGVDLHEVFPGSAVTDYTGSPFNWAPAAQGGISLQTSSFVDVLARWSNVWNPVPTTGNTCPSGPAMLHWEQEWWVGTTAIVSGGVLVMTDSLQFYQGCGFPIY
ncbi:MAG TPA: hypothetical protein VN690_14150, partial [Terriglobales bacterium]|nr:hypothetical protein [Terriglobales bacterium]